VAAKHDNLVDLNLAFNDIGTHVSLPVAWLPRCAPTARARWQGASAFVDVIRSQRRYFG
jgi:hypothetical protein